MSEREKIKWDVDSSIGLIMNEVARRLGVETSVVRKVVTIYYKNISYAMESGKMPKINIIGIGTLRPVPKFILYRIKSLLKKSNDPEEIKRLQEAFEMEDRARDRKKKNKLYKKYE